MSTEVKTEEKHSCCPPGTVGKTPLAPWVQTGEEIKLGDLPVYVSGKGSDRGILVVQEVFGIRSGRLRQICDEIAAAGFVVAMADYNRGDPRLINSDGSTNWSKLGEWVKATPMSKIVSDLDTHVWPLLVSRGAKRFGAVGFCAGSAVVLHLSGAGKLLAGASCHPSHTGVAPMYGTTVAALVEGAKCPQLFYTASNDQKAEKPGGSETKILDDKFGADQNEFKEFPDSVHGFVARADGESEIGARDFRAALAGVLAFLNKHIPPAKKD